MNLKPFQNKMGIRRMVIEFEKAGYGGGGPALGWVDRKGRYSGWMDRAFGCCWGIGMDLGASDPILSRIDSQIP